MKIIEDKLIDNRFEEKDNKINEQESLNNINNSIDTEKNLATNINI